MAKSYLISSAIGRQRFPVFNTEVNLFGRAHYSWSIMADIYYRALREIRSIEPIQAPDIYQHPIAFETRGIDPDVIHLANKPIELLRPLFGHTNVAIQLWEFAEYSDEPINGDPRTDQVRMLKSMDAVWCGSSFTQKSMAAHGINAFYLPPPVAHFCDDARELIDDIPAVTLNSKPSEVQPLTTLGELDLPGSGRTIYVAVLSPFDLRKNIRALIEGFLASKAADNGTLLIKLIVDNITTTVANINQILIKHMDYEGISPHVAFCGAYLSPAQLNSLYALADFHVTAATAEGLNLPLIECMARGIPALSSAQTAMGDYISSDRAIVIDAKRQPTEGKFHALAPTLQTTHFPPTSAAIAAAFSQASGLTPKAREALGAKGATFVNKAFGLKRFEERVNAFEETLA